MMVYAYIYSKCTSFFLQNAHLYSKSSTKIKPNSTFVNKINIYLSIRNSNQLNKKSTKNKVKKKNNNLSSWFFAAAMANLRPQNLPLSAIYCKFYYFS